MYSSDGRGLSYRDDDKIIGSMGCHLTWRELHGIDKNTLVREKKLLEARKAVDFKSRPTLWLSINNLIGFVYYCLSMIQEAEDKFDKVVENDKNNVNAVGNLLVIYKTLSRIGQYRESLRKLRELVTAREELSIARSYADRAHACRYFQEHRRCFTYLSVCDKAVDSGRGLDTPETADWLYDYGLALLRRCRQLVQDSVADAGTKQTCLREVVECFHKVPLVADVSPDLQALAWVGIGVALSLCPGLTLAYNLHSDSADHRESAADCFDKALELRPNDSEVLARIGAQRSMLGMYDSATDLLSRSLEDTESWFAFRHRALLSLKMYEDQDFRACTDEEDLENLLHRARDDLLKALEFNDTHADYSDLGKVYFLLKQPHKALQMFSNAVKSDQDDHIDLSLTHERWAECLTSLGEVEGAAIQRDQQQKARGKLCDQVTSLEKAMQHQHGTNCQGIECDLSRFNYCDTNRPGYANILGEVPVPDVVSSRFDRKLRNYAFRYDFFISFSHIDHKWSVALVQRLENEFGIRGNIRYRDYELGAAIADNIVESVANSYRTLIIMTPDSLNDQWCRYEVQRAHMLNLQRRCVVPVMLRVCQMPRELEHLTFIRCQSGQFKVEDWRRLGRSLRQREERLPIAE